MKTAAISVMSLMGLTFVSVQAVTLRIQGGSTVHVGDRVNITCTCDFNKCYQGVHFRISGVEHNYSILEGGGVTNYNNLSYTTDWNTLTLIYTLVLINATVNDNGTTYQCISSDHEKKAEWSNTETLIVLGSLANPTSSSDATSQPQKSTGNAERSSISTTIDPKITIKEEGTTSLSVITTTPPAESHDSSSIQAVPPATLTPPNTPAMQTTAHNTGGHASVDLENNVLHSTGFPPLQSAVMSTATTTNPLGYIVTSADILHSTGFLPPQSVVTSTTTTTAKTTIKLEQTHVIESNPLGYIVTSPDILGNTGFPPLQSVATSPTTTTTTTTTATMTTTTATPPTPVTSALSTETEGPTLKTNSEKTTEPMKEDDAPTYVYVAVGSGVGIVVYILTIVLIGLVISLKIKGKKAAERRSRRRTPSPEQQGANRYPISIPMVSNPVYSEVVSPSGPAPPYFTVDPCQFGDRQIVVRMDNKYHDVPQRKSVAAESLYDYIDMQ